MPIGAGLPVPAILLFNRSIMILLPQINGEPINFNTDNENYEALKGQQDQYLQVNDNHKDSLFLFLESLQ